MLTLTKIKAVAKKLKVRTLVPDNIIQEVDKGKEHLKADSMCYPTRAAIVKLIQPQRLGMVGSRLGYSAHVMISQCGQLAQCWAWDDERSVMPVAKVLLIERFPWLAPIVCCWTQSSACLDHNAQQMMDLMYFAGGKETQETQRDLTNARRMGRMGQGYILLDGMNMETVRQGFDEWRALPDSQDLAVLEIPDDPKGLALIGPKS